jgi:fumarate reductase flavoprotein subunit
MMGGVHTDINGATPLSGLFAAGEVACVSINGANRLGSNSLPELLVFGARAGQAAAEHAGRGTPISPHVPAQLQDERRRLEHDVLGKSTGRERIADIREQMQKTLEDSAGIYREGAKLAWAVGRLRELQDRAGDVAIEDHSRTFNTERVAALELSFMLDVAEAVVQSALRREESRGAHQRTDFPARDDRRFLAHSVISRTSDRSVRVEYLPVRITRWPPGERVYGEVAPHVETDKATDRTIPAGARV